MSDDDLPARQEPAAVPAVPSAASVPVTEPARERAIEFLRRHCTDGDLTLDEFSDRVGIVFAAETAHDLEVATGDLPVLAGMGQPAPLSDTAAPPRPTRRARAVRWTVSVFGGNQQRGRWRIEQETNAVSFMGGCYLDLREAEVVGNEAVINAFAFMGGVEIVVPEGIDVVLEGFAFMGGKTSRIKDVPIIPGSPLIRIRAFALMGGVNVRSRGPSKPKDRRGRRDRELARAERDRIRSERRDRHAHRHGRPRDLAPGEPPAPPAMPAMAAPPAFAPLPAILRGIEAVAKDVRDEWPSVRAQVAPEGTVTIMFSDIEGFTSINERLGDYQANALLRDHYRLVRDELARHGGFEVKVHGDGFMVAFSSASRALRCAIAIQEAQAIWNRANPDNVMRVRMGLHTGEAIRDADDFLGTTVNLASRIASAARGGEILVSGLLRELCVSSGEFDFDDGTEIELKGISQPHRVFAVRH